jgi:ATP-dependent Clp endopeptidase proteolytic subunit ClpP
MKLALVALSAATAVRAFVVPPPSFATAPAPSSISALPAHNRPLTMRSPVTIRMPTQEPLVPYRAPGSTQDQFIGLQSRQLRERKLWIARYIDDNASNDIISSLLYLQNESIQSRGAPEDIQLYLNIPGANLRPSLAIYDALNELKADGCKISTTNIALCAGMGALIAGAGTKGRRYCLPNARYLLQKTGMDAVFQGQATDIALEVANVKKWNAKINGEISKVTGQTSERIEEDLRRDFYLSSEEAVRYGLIDEVLLPMLNKRQPPSGVVDLGSFQSGAEQKYQGENPAPPGQQPGEQNAGMMRTNDDDDGPKIAKG